MFAKLLLLMLFALMIGGAYHFRPARERSVIGGKTTEGSRLRLMTWNVGYAELEEDSRAHDQDLAAVAETILQQDPDAIALQELTGAGQLKILLGLLKNQYRGEIAAAGGGVDRLEAILVKTSLGGRFAKVPAARKFAVAATFPFGPDKREVTFVSAHADAFYAARRRAYAEDLTDWTQNQPAASLIFIGGDFNFELSRRDESHLYSDNLKHDSEAYSHLLQTFRDLARDAGDTAINDRRIDYLFGPAEAVLFRSAQVLRGAAVGRMDHWPVVVEVALQGQTCVSAPPFLPCICPPDGADT